MRSIWWHVAGAGLLSMAAGCSHLQGRGNLPKLGLPSPKETIAASEDRSAIADALSRGSAHEQAGQLDKARKTYEAALAEHPENGPLNHRLGIVADRQKRHVEAEKHFHQALAGSPQNAVVLGDLGYCYFLQGKLDKAKDALSKAVALDPKNPRHHNNLGLVLGHQQKYDAAFEQFAAAGSEADAYYNMAFVFAAQDLTDEAKGCFQEALASDPSHEGARTALASFEAYDRTPASGRDDTELAANVRYVPYIEGPESGHGDEAVQTASANSSNLPVRGDAGRATRALALKSRSLLGRHMQQERAGNDQFPMTNSQ